jgi:hypothetical protein
MAGEPAPNQTLEETSLSGGRRVCFFEGPAGVQLACIEMHR